MIGEIFMDFMAAAACPVTKVADVDFNLSNTFLCLDKVKNEDSKLIIFPG